MSTRVKILVWGLKSLKTHLIVKSSTLGKLLVISLIAFLVGVALMLIY